MAFATPQRPLPGTFFNTPAASRFGAPAQPIFRQTALSGPQPRQPQPPATAQQPQDLQSRQDTQNRSLEPIARAARTINQTLQLEANFPDLDSYVKQGISSDYELPDIQTEPAWAPFQKTKLYEIPERIFEQWNRAEVSTAMGLFAELNHAWVTIDNALYLWDYTNPNPEIIGFEEQSNGILAVKMVIPRAGVFVNTITHLLVVATTAEMILLGVETSKSAAGVNTVSLYQTRMALSIRGINVKFIEGSAASGRIFFVGEGEKDIYELTYQQEEKWFASRCGKISHTAESYSSFVPAIWNTRSKEYIVDMVVDDSRKLLYTLSSESTIRTYHMDSNSTLYQVIEKRQKECLRDISHMIGNSPLLTSGMKIINISPISAKEGSKLHLMATTTTGCRLFLSATRGYGYGGGQGGAPPSSMQVQHIKFPPRAVANLPVGQQYTGVDQPPEVASQALCYSRIGQRYPPGFFLDLTTKDGRNDRDALFLSAPDTGRISAQSRAVPSNQASRYYEVGCWIDLDSLAEAVGLVTKPFEAGPYPVGFGNELSVQFDEPVAEIAILTNTGIHIIRRRRLVDIFASAVRSGGSEEGFENEVKKFIRQYGRGETTATALAVACGQGNDVSPATLGDSRVARINDPETLELARKCFVEYGGRPTVNDNGVSESLAQAVENVQPSARHEGLALYIGRLVRSLWTAPVIKQTVSTLGAAMEITTTVPISKLQAVQEDLMRLKTFLDKNKSFIEGLAGPESLQRATSQQEEVALQGEHQALYSLQQLNSSIIEGISFVQMLFDERVDEIWTNLEDAVKQRFTDLTYELLFSTEQGKDLAKVLVKAIVNRNIANGSNVDTVAEALRRRCGSFCSADDVIIFKAQELLKKASEVGATSDLGRSHLNESLRLFQQVAGALSFDNLQTAAEQFTGLQFYAGAISLVLHVANEHDRGNKALAWVQEGRPDVDARQELWTFRDRCYDLVHDILLNVDQVTSDSPEYIDGKITTIAQKRLEAYDEVHASEDELFQFDLYDWYLSQGWTERLIAIQSPYVVTWLTLESRENPDRADLLWRYYVHQQDFYSAATVQHDLAKSSFPITLARRIELLSRAKANANTQSGNIGRQQRQVLLHSVSELLEVANIQDEILHRLRGDARISEERKAAAIAELDGTIMEINLLYNVYADAAQYYDICLLILECANHRNEADINSTWQFYIEQTHRKVLDDPDNAAQQPYEAIVNMMRGMAQRLKSSEATFSPKILIPLIEAYSFENQNNIGPQTWVPDLFIEVGFAYETILSYLQGIWLNDVTPFTGRNKQTVGDHILYICEQWYKACVRSNTRLFDTEENAAGINDILNMLVQGTLGPSDIQRAEDLSSKIVRAYR